MSNAAFKAFLISQDGSSVAGRFVDFTVDQLDPGEVTIRVAYSSINYKDALAATGTGRIIRRFPCIGGIDLSGTVMESRDPRFAAGDRVLATSFDIGVAHHGGYAEFARLPADWVRKLPEGLTLQQAMALGTAGFTAALAVLRMEDNGLRPDRGPVIVNGATGGVGSLAIDMLAGLGYEITALTGKEGETEYLKRLGATNVMLRSELDLAKIKPLDKSLWAGAVDNLGGDFLAWMITTMKQGGTVASIGLAAGMNLNTSVAPFILRGVSLLGIDSGYIGEPQRGLAWQRLASDLKPRHLAAITRTVAFADLPTHFEDFLNARVTGRTVVEIAAAS